MVVCGWVIFRSPSLDTAGKVFGGMAGRNGAYLPDQVLRLVPPLRHLYRRHGRQVPYLGDSTVMGTFEVFVMLALGFGIVFLAPNLYQMNRRARLVPIAHQLCLHHIKKILFAGAMSPFLYFQF